MNFPKFWALGTSDGFSAWRWSFQSLAEAQSSADTAARQLAERYRRGPWPPTGGCAYYPDRPPREQILQEINDGNALTAVVTRNSYGSQVLNTARVMFVDIDLQEPLKPKRGILNLLFGRRRPSPPQTDPKLEEEALMRVETWTANNFGWGWRVYRTRSGLRLLATQGTVRADAPTTDEIFEALGADPLYRKLCKNQKCFRARLTPKPWRCDIGQPPPRWPWTEKEERKFHKWEAEYIEASADWATCEFVRQIGSATVHPEVQSIVQLHDEATKVGLNLPLA